MKIKRMILLMLTVAMLVECIATTNVEAKVFTKTGGYYTGLCTKDDKNDKYDSYAKKLKFKSSKFTLYGTMHYTKPGDVYSYKIYKEAKRTYKIASNCKFYRGYYKNGEYKKQKISKKKLKKLALPLTKGSISNRMLAWDIKGGKVIKLEYREY
jgi:hypothetical protein